MLGLKNIEFEKRYEDIYERLIENKPEIEAIMANIGVGKTESGQ
ncbi:hypothetical protein ACFL6P_08295 [Candidatus Latescibacterota bacterium]